MENRGQCYAADAQRNWWFLFGLTISSLASGHEENTKVASPCLGALAGKLGDMMLLSIISVLRHTLYRSESDIRLGACVDLTEVIGFSSKEKNIKVSWNYSRGCVRYLVRRSRGCSKYSCFLFQSLHTLVANKVFDEVVPVSLVAMKNGAKDKHKRARAITGVINILKIRS